MTNKKTEETRIIGKINVQFSVRTFCIRLLGAVMCALNFYVWWKYGWWMNAIGGAAIIISTVSIELVEHKKRRHIASLIVTHMEEAHRLLAHGCCPNGHGLLALDGEIRRCATCGFHTDIQPT